MKFICTDFWTCIYKKQIDNLRTNHQGVYVLQDNAFRFLTNFSNGHQYLEYAPRVSYILINYKHFTSSVPIPSQQSVHKWQTTFWSMARFHVGKNELNIVLKTTKS